MKTFHAFPLNPIDALASQVIIAGADGIAVASALKTINGQSLLGAGNIAISVDLSGYLPIAGGTMAGNLDMDHYQISNVQAIDSDEITLNGLPVASEQYASSASNLTSGTVPDARLSANVTLLGNATTGTGGIVRDTSPTLVTPNLGVATATSLAVTTITIGAGVSIVRNATGPTLETRAAGGLKVCNADGSALAALTCGVFTTDFGSGVDIQTQAANWRIGHRNGGVYQTGFDFYHLNFNSSYLVRWSNSSSNITTIDTTLSRASAGVLQIGNAPSANALGSLNLANLTASGVAKFNGYPTGLLPAAASNAGSITYDTTLAKHVGCNGSSWNALW